MAFNFKAPQWNSNTKADKACTERLKTKKVFKQKFKRKASHDKGHNENTHTSISKIGNKKTNKKSSKENNFQLKRNTFKSVNSLKQTIVQKSASQHTNTNNKLYKNNKKELNTNRKTKNKNEKFNHSKVYNKEPMKPKRQKQIANSSSISKEKPKFQAKIKSHPSEKQLCNISRKQELKMSLRECMMKKLRGAPFRYLNEQMYTKTGHDSKTYFKINLDGFMVFLQIYREQVAKWPLNPLDKIIANINKMPKNFVVADFGCGEGGLAKSVSQKVYSFDIVAIDDSITACDMSNVPLKNSTVDVAVFCVSLMGTNLKQYIWEAARVLKTGGILKIVDVESSFFNIDTFIQGIQKFGFSKVEVDLTHGLFWFLDFKKDSRHIQPQQLPDIRLSTCIYRKI